jgi:hypothetical protein
MPEQSLPLTGVPPGGQVELTGATASPNVGKTLAKSGFDTKQSETP